jgi:hypothetical protein
MKVMSRIVKLSFGGVVVLQVESYLLKDFDILGAAVHPRGGIGIVLGKGVYSLEVGEFRELELLEDE